MKVVLPIVDPVSADQDCVVRLHEALEVLWLLGVSPVDKPADDDPFYDEVKNSDYGKATASLIEAYKGKTGLTKSGWHLNKPTADHMNELLLAAGLIGRFSGQIKQSPTSPAPTEIQMENILIYAYRGVGHADEQKWPWHAYTNNKGEFTLYIDVAEPISDQQPVDVQVRAFFGSKEQRVGSSHTKIGAIRFDSTTEKIVYSESIFEVEVDFGLFRDDYELEFIQNLFIYYKIKENPLDIKFVQMHEIDRLENLLVADGKKVDRLALEHCVLAHLMANDAAQMVGEFMPWLHFGLLRNSKISYVEFTGTPHARTDVRLTKFVGPPDGDETDYNFKWRLRLLESVAYYSRFEGQFAESPEMEIADAIRTAVVDKLIANVYFLESGEKKFYLLEQSLLQLNESYFQNSSEINRQIRKYLRNLRQYIGSEPKFPFHILVDGSECLCPAENCQDSRDALDGALADQDFLDLIVHDGQAIPPVQGVAQELHDKITSDLEKESVNRLALLSGDAFQLSFDCKWNTDKAAALLSIQRVAKLTDDQSERAFLLRESAGGEDGALDSAWKVRGMGRRRFRKAYVDALHGEGIDLTTTKRKADKLYDRAVRRTEMASHWLAEAHALGTAQHVNALCSTHDRKALTDKAIPGISR